MSKCSDKQDLTGGITELPCDHEETVMTEVGECDRLETQMTSTELHQVPVGEKNKATDEEDLFLNDNQKRIIDEKSVVDKTITSALDHNSASLDCASVSVTGSSLPAEVVRTPPRLKLSVLKSEMKIKPHVKPRGRPKHSGTIWPSKSKAKSGKRKKVHTDIGKENHPPNKRQCLDDPASDSKQKRIAPGNPAYLIKMRRKRVVDSKTNTDDKKIIDLSKCVSSSTQIESPQFTVCGQNIYKSDLQLLKSKHEWLNEPLIDAGQRMLREKFPNTTGLHDVCFCDTLSFPHDPPEGVVQILNVANSHWVCISSKDCKPGTIMVYDSLRSGDLPLSVKEVIAALLKCDKKKIFLLFPDVQQQPNSSSCGLFALANAYTLCEGKDPTKVKYDVSLMRTHLLHCVQKHEFTAFPSTGSMYNPAKPLSTSFRIYCLCRLPDRGDKMVCCDECKEWFHFVCMDLDVESQLDDTWKCGRCSD